MELTETQCNELASRFRKDQVGAPFGNIAIVEIKVERIKALLPDPREERQIQIEKDLRNQARS